MDTRQRRRSGCCDTVGFCIYALVWILIHLCPVIGQIRAVWILCHPAKYLKNEDEFERKQAKFALMLSSYFVGYFLIWLVMTFCLWIAHGWSSDNAWYRHTVQMIGGLIIFKLWYESINCGSRWIYGETEEKKPYGFGWQLIGHLFMTLGTLGFFVPFRIIQLIYKHWNSPNPYKKHLAQTLGGLIIFKIWYELFHYGHEWIYKWERIPPGRGEIGGKRRPYNSCKKLLGHIFLTIATLGLFLPFRLVQIIYDNWDSPTPWKRHLAQTIGSLIIFKLWYELGHYGYRWIYKKRPVQNKDDDGFVMKPHSLCYRIIGHLFLTIATLGLFFPVRVIELVFRNWTSETSWKRHLAQTVGGLVVFKIWYELGHHGDKWTYGKKKITTLDGDGNEVVTEVDYSCCHRFTGQIFLTIATLGIFVLFRFFQIIYDNWDSKNPWKRHAVQTVAGLIILKIWYELFHYGIRWIYKKEQLPQKPIVTDLSGAAVPTAEPTPLPPPSSQQPTERDYSPTKKFFGHIFLTLATLGFFLPYRLIELVCKNWNSRNPYKRHLAQTIGGLVIFKLWYELIFHGYKWIYTRIVMPNTAIIGIDADGRTGSMDGSAEPPPVTIPYGYGWQFLGHIYLTLATFGLFLPFRLIQVIYTNWNSKNPWRRHTVQTIAGLIIFKLWYEMFTHGWSWIYGNRGTDRYIRGRCYLICPSRKYENNPGWGWFILGHLFLTITTLGIFIPIRIVQVVIVNWSSEEWLARHLAQTAGGLIIFKLWYEMVRYGQMWVYPKPIPCKPLSECSPDPTSPRPSLVDISDITDTPTVTAAAEEVADPVATEDVKLQIGDDKPDYHSTSADDHIHAHPDLSQLTRIPQVNLCQSLLGHLFLTIASLGLFIPYRFGELIYLNWFSPNPWKRHTAQTIGGLVIGKIWYELAMAGDRWIYDTETVPIDRFGRLGERSYPIWKQILGHLFLILVSFGFFIPYRIIQLIYDHWKSPVAWKRHLAQTFGGLIIFKIWYELFNYGLKWVYPPPPKLHDADTNTAPDLETANTTAAATTTEQISLTKQLWGHLFLTIASLGVFVPWRIIELIAENFFSKTTWKRHLAQTIAGLIIFKLWYEMFVAGWHWVYPKKKLEPSEPTVDDDTTATKPKTTTDVGLGYQILGHLFLTLTTLGFFIPCRIIELTVNNFFSETAWKRHLAQTVGGLIIFKLWAEMLRWGTIWFFKMKSIPDPNNPERNISVWYPFWLQSIGYLFLVVGTLGLFFLCYGLFWLCYHFHSENRIKKHLAQTIVGLVIFKLWYELFHFGIKWSYKKKMVITGPFDPETQQVPTEWHEYSCGHKFLGYCFLTLGSFGFFIPYRIIELVHDHWNSDSFWKRNTAQLVGGLVIFKLWYELFQLGRRWYYTEAHSGFFSRLFGFGCLLIATLGTLLLFEFGRLIKVIVDSHDFPPGTPERNHGDQVMHAMTLGLSWIITSRRSSILWKRWLTTGLISIFNLAIILGATWLVYEKTDWLAWEYLRWITLTGLIISYPVIYMLQSYIIYNANVRRLASWIWKHCVAGWWRFSHFVDMRRWHCKRRHINRKNWFSRVQANFRNWRSRVYANHRNVTRFTWTGRDPITEEDPRYYRPHEYHPTVYVVPAEPNWQNKMERRLRGVKALETQFRIQMTQVLNRVEGELNYAWSVAAHLHPRLKEIFWHDRFNQIDDRLVFADETVTALAERMVEGYRVKHLIPTPDVKTAEEYRPYVQNYRAWKKQIKSLRQQLKTKRESREDQRAHWVPIINNLLNPETPW